jgi:hypothetical protein
MAFFWAAGPYIEVFATRMAIPSVLAGMVRTSPLPLHFNEEMLNGSYFPIK